jgi:hypothetical protein
MADTRKEVQSIFSHSHSGAQDGATVSLMAINGQPRPLALNSESKAEVEISVPFWAVRARTHSGNRRSARIARRLAWSERAIANISET